MYEGINSILLKENLKNLIPAIKGKWFLGDGGLLGIERSGDIIPYDNDLDIFLFPDSYIDKKILKEQGLELQKYYMDTKIYNPKYAPNNLNSWREFCSYYHHINLDKKWNRNQLYKNASEAYKMGKIKPAFTLPYIDVFHLTEDFKVPHWNNIYFTKEEMNLEENYDLGFKIYIPSNRPQILERQYGKDWRVENPNFSYHNIERIKETVL
jgi:hypothetical protein